MDGNPVETGLVSSGLGGPYRSFSTGLGASKVPFRLSESRFRGIPTGIKCGSPVSPAAPSDEPLCVIHRFFPIFFRRVWRWVCSETFHCIHDALVP